jgi:uroporphyrinogen decarboxylase
MTSYERVKAALEHREPDKIPFDLGGTMVSGINIKALEELKRYLGITQPPQVKDVITQMAHTGEDMIEYLKVDVKNVGPRVPEKSRLKDLGYDNAGSHFVRDEWGMEWRMPPGGYYYDLHKSPLAFVETVKDVENYPWPDALDSYRYSKMKEEADRIVYQEQKAYVLGRMSSGMWEHAMWMTGYEKFFTDMYLNPAVCQAIMEKILEVKMQYWERALEAVGENVLVASCADDLGSQEGLLIDLDLYKELIWPYHKRLFEFIKKKAQSRIYIFFHNDGAIMETLPLLIEAGVDIINPFQVNCKGMDTKKFKKEFGFDLTVWGGSCDTQRVLPYGTPDEVRKETRQRIEDLAPGGGFIFAPIHVIQNGVPPENIMAWWETLQMYNQ